MPESRLRSDEIPRHVAIIMDGNGRWAEQRGISRLEGHREGLGRVRDIVRAANELGIQYLTLYAFSLENWNRPKLEVDGLMRLLSEYLATEIDEVARNGIQLRTICRTERLPISVQRAVDGAIERTKNNDQMKLVFALSYGGRAEIVDAARKLLRDAERGEIDPDHVDEKTFGAYLYDPSIPDPYLLIRTGAEHRVSNFLLWQASYAEIWVTDVLWPDFQIPHLNEGLEFYATRKRKFGAIEPS